MIALEDTYFSMAEKSNQVSAVMSDNLTHFFPNNTIIP